MPPNRALSRQTRPGSTGREKSRAWPSSWWMELKPVDLMMRVEEDGKGRKKGKWAEIRPRQPPSSRRRHQCSVIGLNVDHTPT